MNNEMTKPVAWMMKANDPDNDKDWLCFGRLPTRDEKVSHQAIPLHTHPVKELTDEEIEEVINRTYWVGTEDEIRFKIAEAILRKAQK